MAYSSFHPEMSACVSKHWIQRRASVTTSLEIDDTVLVTSDRILLSAQMLFYMHLLIYLLFEDLASTCQGLELKDVHNHTSQRGCKSQKKQET